MSANDTVKINLSYWINSLLVIFFMFGFRFVIPPFAQVTEVGMQVLGVFIGCVWGWVFTGKIGWPSLLGIVALGMTDYIDMATLLANGFASQTAIMLLGLFILTAYVSAEGLGECIVNFLLTRKFTQGRPFVILFTFMLAAFLTGVLSESVAVAVLFIELFRVMIKNTGIPIKSRAISVFMVGISLSTVISAVSLPVKGAAIMYMGTLSAITGYTYNPIIFSLFNSTVCIMIFAAYVLLCKYILRIDLSMLQEIGELPGMNEPVSKRKKIALTAVVVIMVSLMLPSILPKTWEITLLLNKMGLGGLSCLFIATLCIIRIDEEPLLSFPKIAGRFSWDMYFLIVILFPVANALTAEACGIKTTLGAVISSVASGLPMFLLACFLIAACAIVTNFANNVVVAVLFITIAGTISTTMLPNLNVAALSICLMLVCNASVFFPAASPINAMCFSQTDIVDFKHEVIIGLWMTALVIGLACTLIFGAALLIF